MLLENHLNDDDDADCFEEDVFQRKLTACKAAVLPCSAPTPTYYYYYYDYSSTFPVKATNNNVCSAIALLCSLCVMPRTTTA